VYTDPDFVPFEPPPQPLGLRGLPTLWRNYIESVPRSCYEQGLTRIEGRGMDALLVCDPDVIQDIFVEKADAFRRDPATRRSFAPMIGDNSLFLADGADWRWQRRAVAPIFRHEMLLSFVPVFAAMAERQTERWRAAQHGVPVDAAAGMTRTTFDIIVETMLGGPAGLDADGYNRALTVNFETIPWHLIYAMFSVPQWMPYPNRRRAMRARDFLHQEVRQIVEARRATPSGRSDLLDLLLKARDPETGRSMTDVEVMQNLLTFITAGHETTAVALSWTLWLIAKDQSTQDQLYDEVTSVTGNGIVTASQIDSLTYCRQVIQEAMRLFPPAAAIARQPKGAMTLGGFQLTARSRVHVPVFALHRNTQLWRHPDAFDPDRFTADRVKARSRYAYLPFGAGLRTCIGAGFAMIEAAAILATMMRAFRFRPLAGHKPMPVARLTLRPAGGMPLLIEPR
jgi:cytochrome P450